MTLRGFPETAARLGPGTRQGPGLVVEDDPADAHSIERLLATSVYQPLVAQSVRDALQVMQTVTPAAIMLDMLLPGDESWRLMVQLRQRMNQRGHSDDRDFVIRRGPEGGAPGCRRVSGQAGGRRTS